MNSRKTPWRGAAVGVVVGMVPSVGGSLYLLSYALRPDAAMRKKHASAYEYMYAEYPFLRPWVDSLERRGALRDTVIAGRAGERLHALYVAAPEPTDRTAVIVHGYTDEAVRMLMIGYLYNHDLGYNILLPDLHYHGESEGSAVRMGWLDRFDVLRWMEVANELFGGDTQMVVHGISMGAATTMMVSGEVLPSYVKCFVEDCGYTSVHDQFAKELREQFRLPVFPLLDVASLFCRAKYGWGFREASALEQVRKCELPMLFIHGGADDFVPTSMVYPLFDAKPGEKELWIAPGSAHAMSYRDHREEYTRRVGEFVGRYVD
ncbi:MAG: alpha/beta hydrolase [Alistipes sp.]|nr:alpha/beta hydrolase [Alistipes sp.]